PAVAGRVGRAGAARDSRGGVPAHRAHSGCSRAETSRSSVKSRNVRINAMAATRPMSSQVGATDVSMMSAASWNVRPTTSQRAYPSHTARSTRVDRESSIARMPRTSASAVPIAMTTSASVSIRGTTKSVAVARNSRIPGQPLPLGAADARGPRRMGRARVMRPSSAERTDAEDHADDRRDAENQQEHGSEQGEGYGEGRFAVDQVLLDQLAPLAAQAVHELCVVGDPADQHHDAERDERDAEVAQRRHVDQHSALPELLEDLEDREA